MLYLRQSRYREESVSFELQEASARDYCARMGYDVIDVLRDRSTGKVWKNRPDVQRAIHMVESGDAEVIVLWKWSRLSRNRMHWAIAADTVAVAGGRIESSTEPIDTTTASGRFARGVMTEYAAFQSEQIGEVWEEVRQRRLRLGLPASGRLPWGWEWTGDGGIRSVPEQADVVREMFRRYLAGDGSAAISRWLNAEGIPAPNGGIWNRVRPFTVMDSPIHAGLIPYRDVEYPGAHDGIIDAATWSAYKSTRATRREGHEKPRTGSRYLLSGLARCGCGLRMTGKGAVTGGIWYSGYLCTSMDPEHGPRYVSSLRIDPLVHRWVTELDIDRFVPGAPKIANTGAVERLTAEWNAQQSRLDKLTRYLLDGTVPEASYRATREEVEREQQRVQRDLDAARARLARTPDIDVANVASLANDWHDLADDLRHRMLTALLEEVTIRPGESVTFRSRWGEQTTLPL